MQHMMFHHGSRPSPRLAASVIVVLLAGLGILAWQTSSKTEPEYHVHAAFDVYVDGQLQDYSDLQYMHVEPCTVAHNDQPEDDQIEKAHLHDGVGDIVHSHRANATWGDLFQNIKVTLPPPVSGYSNGQAVKDILSQPIKAYDRVLITAGTAPENLQAALDQVPSVDYIRQQEQAIESC